MPSRKEVYAAIDGERQYQEDIWKKRCAEVGIPYTPDLEKSVGDWITFVRGYYDEANDIASHKPGSPVQDIFRKLAGMCFACMEVNGVVGRYGPKVICVPGGQLPVKRDVIQRVVDVERSYQDELPPSRTDGSKKNPNDYLVMFGTYLRKAEDGWTNSAGYVIALDNIRKLAGIAVRCMEEHGAPHREGY